MTHDEMWRILVEEFQRVGVHDLDDGLPEDPVARLVVEAALAAMKRVNEHA